jgi:hypothetical protein
VLSRAAFFTWTAILGKILTLDNLKKRRAIVINRCCMCKRDGESVDHLLIQGDVASALWSAIFSRFRLAWVMPRRVLDLCASWWSSGRTRSTIVWKMVPSCLFWIIWRERNNRCFEDLENVVVDIVASMLNTLYIWKVAYLAPIPITYTKYKNTVFGPMFKS